MREILFRGKDIDGKWVQGYCIKDEMDENKVYIGYIFGSDGRQPHDTDVVMVDPKTICQYIGLTDKNGRKIFEGDILSSHLDDQYPENITYVQITWDGFSWCMRESTKDDVMSEYDCNTFEVCGNIFDNPELIGEQP